MEQIPRRYFSEQYDLYAEAAELLFNQQTLKKQVQNLNQIGASVDKVVSNNIRSNHIEISKYLSNIQQCENILIDYIAEIKSLRKDLQQRKKNLKETKTNPKGIWLKKYYYKSILQGLRELGEIRSDFTTVQNMIKEKLFNKAGTLIRRLLYKIEKAEFNYLAVFQTLKQALEGTLRLLAQAVLKDLKSLLFMDSSMLETDFKKFYVVGLLNIEFLVGDDYKGDTQELNQAIPSYLDSLQSIDSLDEVNSHYVYEIRKDLKKMFQECFSQMHSNQLQSPSVKREFTLTSLFPTDSIKTALYKICNGVIALSVLILKNHMILTKCLLQYNIRFSIQPIYSALQTEFQYIVKTIVSLPTGSEEQQNPYTHLLQTLLPLSNYNFPFVYPLLSTYSSTLSSIFSEQKLTGELQRSIQDIVVVFLETMKKDASNLFVECLSSPDSFRQNKANSNIFPAVSVLTSNIDSLTDLQSLFSNQGSELASIVAKQLYLFMSELTKMYDKYSMKSDFNQLMKDQVFFEDIRADQKYNKARLAFLASDSENIRILYELDTQRFQGLYHKIVMQHAYFQSLPKFSFIEEESAKLGSIAVLLKNLDKLFSHTANFIRKAGHSIVFHSSCVTPVDSSVQDPFEPKGKFTNLAVKVKEKLSKKKFPNQASQRTSIEDTQLKFQTQIRKVQQYYDRCVFLLKGEIQLRVFQNLYQLKGRNYWRDVEFASAEDFINQLVRELRSIYITTKPLLPLQALAFIWGDVFDLIQLMFVIGLREIQDSTFSKHGLSIYIKNVTSLKDELSLLEIPEHPQWKVFNKLIEYLDLLYLNEKSLVKFIVDNYYKYTREEWEIMTNVKAPVRPYGVSRQSFRVIDEILRR